MRIERIYTYLILSSLLWVIPFFGHAQVDTFKHKIIIHFKYGSRPAKGCDDTEDKWFGGIHGGHVVMELDSEIFSFYPTEESFHIFPHSKKKHGIYVLEKLKDWTSDTATIKFASIVIPLTEKQYNAVLDVKKKYLAAVPYDYAFLGMRCAAATYDVLWHAGVTKPLSNFRNIIKNFYPKPFRKRLLQYAKKHHLPVIKHEGRKTRVWEDD